MNMVTNYKGIINMKSRKTFGQIIITVMFIYSAILCHFHASSLLEDNKHLEAYLYWFFCTTAVAGALRFKIAGLVEKFMIKSRKNK